MQGVLNVSGSWFVWKHNKKCEPVWSKTMGSVSQISYTSYKYWGSYRVMEVICRSSCLHCTCCPCTERVTLCNVSWYTAVGWPHVRSATPPSIFLVPKFPLIVISGRRTLCKVTHIVYHLTLFNVLYFKCLEQIWLTGASSKGPIRNVFEMAEQGQN